jgi:hypothetical protein
MLGLVMAMPAMADTPASLKGPHGHGVNVQGNITLFRVQEQGLELGEGKEKIDAEVLVTIDTNPEMVYGLRLHEDNPATREMVETLRQAYINKVPVKIQHPIAPGKKNVKITWVELSGE